MEITFEELLEKQTQNLRSLLKHIHHQRQDDEKFIRQRSIESVEEYFRVVSIFGECIAQNYSMSILYDGLYNED